MNIEHLHQRRLLMLFHHLQTSSDLLVRELISQLLSTKFLLSKAAKFASDLELNNISQFTSGQLKIAICSAQWQKLSISFAWPDRYFLGVAFID